MKQTDLIKKVSDTSGLTQVQVGDALNALGIEVRNALSLGDEVPLPGIGKLSVTERAARAGRNPRTGEIIPIEAKKTPKFSAAKALKDAVNG